ncbi:MAG: Ig-like domain-containing protein, partial [Flavobacteriaceae bacterium]|nr:Ig-like domain-containing protein [Flavobacteriaceae bacterium]
MRKNITLFIFLFTIVFLPQKSYPFFKNKLNTTIAENFGLEIIKINSKFDFIPELIFNEKLHIPKNRLNNLYLNAELEIVFSNKIVTGFGNIIIKRKVDDVAVTIIDVLDDKQINFNNKVLKIKPHYSFSANTDYYIDIATTAIKKVGKTKHKYFKKNLKFNFKTAEFTAPVFSSTPITTTNEGVDYEYYVDVTDTYTDTYTITAPTLPSWLTLVQNQEVSTIAGGSGVFDKVNGIVRDSNGNFFISDRDNHRIRKIATDGTVTTFAGSGVPGFGDGTGTAAIFNSPLGITIDASDNLYVADHFNSAIRKITPAGVVTTFATGLSNPSGLTFGPLGDLYVASRGDNKIYKVSPLGVVTDYAGTGTLSTIDGTLTTASFTHPGDVAFDSSGNLYVSEETGHVIRKITPGGEVTTFAGAAGVADDVNGVGTSARFNTPYGLAFDTSDNLYVADIVNDKIRKITPDGTVSDYAGSGLQGDEDGLLSEAKLNAPSCLFIDPVTEEFYFGSSLTDKVKKVGNRYKLVGNSLGHAGDHPVELRAEDSGGLSSTQNFTITVVDVIDPTLTSTIPADNTFGVAVGANLQLTFNEDVKIGTGNISIKQVLDDVAVATIAVTDATQISITDNVLTINPSSDLAGNTEYYVEVDATAIDDIANNSFAGITNKTIFNFGTTAPIAPTIDSTPTPTTINEGDDFSYYIATFDANQDAVTVTAPTFPSWLTLSTGLGVSTFAGTTIGDTNGDRKTAQFKKMGGMVQDSNGNLFVVDRDNHKIKKINPLGEVTTFAGAGVLGFLNGEGTVARFNEPVGITIDASDNLYVVDKTNSRIRKITPNAVVTTFAGGGIGNNDGIGTAARFNQPTDIVIDHTGTYLYVSDRNNHTIRRIEIATQEVITFAGTALSSGTSDGTGTAARFNIPAGLAVDSSGNLFVADEFNNTIRKITPAGVVTTFAGSGADGSANGMGTAASFTQPWGLAIDASDNLYVSEPSPNYIRKITPTGSVSAYAGIANSSAADKVGDVATARFFFPAMLLIDNNGDLLVGDNGNYKIKKISTMSRITGNSLGFAGTHNVSLRAEDPGGLFDTQNFTITVEDATAPTLTSTSPADNATNVALDANLELTFSENIQAGTGAILIKRVSDDVTKAIINVTSGQVSITGNVLTINPTLVFDSNTEYYIELQATTIDDLAGNSFAGIADKTTFNFTTLTQVPSTITFADITKTYGDADFTLSTTSNSSGAISYSIVGAANGTTLSGTNNEDVSLGNAGAVTIRATQAADGIYATTTKDITLTINKATLTATAEDKSRDYGEANPVFTLTYSGFKGSDDSSVLDTAPTVATTATTTTDVGTVAITVAGGSDSNYDITPVNGTLTIGKATLIATAEDKSRDYGEANPVFTITYLGFKGSDDSSVLDTAPTASTAATAASIAGTYEIDVLGASDTNYDFNYVKGTLTINAVGTSIVTSAATGITRFDAILNGNITSDGGSAITERGFVFSKTSENNNPEIGGANVTKEIVTGTTGVYNFAASSLDMNTGYSFRAFSTNSTGTTYGATQTFTTLSNNNPAFTSTPITEVNEGDTYSYRVTTNDIDNDNVSITTTTVPSWLTLITKEVTTFAGTMGTRGSDDGVGTAATFYTPQGLDIDASGNLYVADVRNEKIRKVTSDGTVSTFVDVGSFSSPKDVALDISGNLYVADIHTIYKVTSSGVVSILAGSGTPGDVDGVGTAASFNSLLGIAVDASGNIYVSDSGNNKIKKITSTGVVSTLAGSGAIGDADGVGTAASFNSPNGLVVDALGNAYVSDSRNNKIRKITSTGVVSTLAGSGATGNLDAAGNLASFNNPTGIEIDASGNLYVANQISNTIRKITPDGTVSTITGIADVSGGDNGALNVATFNSPTAIAIDDATGNLFIGDASNFTIRKVTMSDVLQGNSLGNAGVHSVVLKANDGNGGEVNQTFTVTVKSVPTVATEAAINVSQFGATMNGEVTSDGGAAISERGFVISVTSDNNDPEIGGSN